MELAQLIVTVVSLICVVVLLCAVFRLMWQMNSRSNRLIAKTDARGRDKSSGQAIKRED